MSAPPVNMTDAARVRAILVNIIILLKIFELGITYQQMPCSLSRD
jgi:hypothetical protein